MKWKDNEIKKVRIFTLKGVELMEDSIEYISNKGEFFVSKGNIIRFC